MAKHIDFSYDGKDYKLEFNRDTFRKAEAKGITQARLEALAENPSDAIDLIPELWYCAFAMHHPEVTKDLASEIYHSMADKGGKDGDLGLLGALTEIFAEPIITLYTEPGNTKWSKNWK